MRRVCTCAGAAPGYPQHESHCDLNDPYRWTVEVYTDGEWTEWCSWTDRQTAEAELDKARDDEGLPARIVKAS